MPDKVQQSTGETVPLVERVEQDLAAFLEEKVISSDYKDTAKVILYAFEVGVDADKIAKVSGLNRDFVRAKMKILRKNGCFEYTPTKEAKICVGGETPEEVAIDFLLMVLCAEGLVERFDG